MLADAYLISNKWVQNVEILDFKDKRLLIISNAQCYVITQH